MYTFTCKDDKTFSVTLADENHPIFKAHFPNNPILPGFILLDISAQILHVEIVHVKKAKFLHSILPQSLLHFHVEEKDKTLKIIVKQNEQKVADLHYEKK